MTAGWVYVITNPSMPELVKVGFTTRHPKKRAQELNGTGVPHSFVAEYAIRVEDPDALERAVHDHLRQLGLGVDKEWFKCTKERALAVILEIGAEEVLDRYCAEDEARRLKELQDRRVELERERVREEILRKFRQDREKRAQDQRSREKAGQEAKDREAIRKHHEQIEKRRLEVTDEVRCRYPDVFLEEVDRIRLWPIFCLSALSLGALALSVSWAPGVWLALPVVAGLLAVRLRAIIIRVRRRSPKWREAARRKEHLLKSIDEILPYPAYDWYRHEIQGEPVGFLAPLPEEAHCRVTINASIDDVNGSSLRGDVYNANPNWVISGVDLRVPEGYSPPSVRLPLCILPGELTSFTVRLLGRGVRATRYGRPKWVFQQVGKLRSVGVGGSFGYEVSEPSSEILAISRGKQRETVVVPWSQ